MNKLGLNWLELLVTFSFVHAADGFTEAAGSEQCTTGMLKKNRKTCQDLGPIFQYGPRAWLIRYICYITGVFPATARLFIG